MVADPVRSGTPIGTAGRRPNKDKLLTHCWGLCGMILVQNQEATNIMLRTRSNQLAVATVARWERRLSFLLLTLDTTINQQMLRWSAAVFTLAFFFSFDLTLKF